MLHVEISLVAYDEQAEIAFDTPVHIMLRSQKTVAQLVYTPHRFASEVLVLSQVILENFIHIRIIGIFQNYNSQVLCKLLFFSLFYIKYFSDRTRLFLF